MNKNIRINCVFCVFVLFFSCQVVCLKCTLWISVQSVKKNSVTIPPLFGKEKISGSISSISNNRNSNISRKLWSFEVTSIFVWAPYKVKMVWVWNTSQWGMLASLRSFSSTSIVIECGRQNGSRSFLFGLLRATLWEYAADSSDTGQ